MLDTTELPVEQSVDTSTRCWPGPLSVDTLRVETPSVWARASTLARVVVGTETQSQGLETRVVAQAGALPIERVDFARVDRHHAFARTGDQVLAGLTLSTIAGALTQLARTPVRIETSVHAALVVPARDRRAVVPRGRVAPWGDASRRLGEPGGTRRDSRCGAGLSGRGERR